MSDVTKPQYLFDNMQDGRREFWRETLGSRMHEESANEVQWRVAKWGLFAQLYEYSCFWEGSEFPVQRLQSCTCGGGCYYRGEGKKQD